MSSQELDDLSAVTANVSRAQVFVRLNPLHEGTAREVERALALGARVMMLPFFTGPREVASFVEMVGGRASPVLLLETAAAAACIGDIVAVEGVAEIVVGLNDLHISLGFATFSQSPSDRMNTIACRVREAGIRFGFGGVARVDDGSLPVPPDLIYAQYARLGATSAWLSRSFYRNIEPDEIGPAVHALRERLRYWPQQATPTLNAQREELAAVAQALGATR